MKYAIKTSSKIEWKVYILGLLELGFKYFDGKGIEEINQILKDFDRGFDAYILLEKVKGSSQIKISCANKYLGLDPYKQVTFPELLKEIEKMPSTEKVKLNEEYTALVRSDGIVEVGCQEFSIVAVKEILNVYERME